MRALTARLALPLLALLSACSWETITRPAVVPSPYARLETAVDSANAANRAVYAATGASAVIVVVNFDSLTPPIPLVAGRLTSPAHLRLRTALDSATVAFRAIYAGGGRGSLAMVPEATPPMLITVGLR